MGPSVVSNGKLYLRNRTASCATSFKLVSPFIEFQSHGDSHQGSSHEPPRKFSAIGLLLAELIVIIGATWWPDSGPATMWAFLMHAILFGVGGYHLSQSRKWFAIFIPLALLALIANFIGDSLGSLLIREISVTLVHIFLFWAIFHHSFIRENVSKVDRLLAGIAGYLLLGLLLDDSIHPLQWLRYRTPVEYRDR